MAVLSPRVHYACKPALSAVTLDLSTPKRRERGANCLGDIVGRKMRIVTFRHACVAMSELRRDDAHWNAAHSKGTCVSVAKNVEGRGGFDLRSGACRVQWPLLMRWPPSFHED
jgi:hypothetical protein